MTTVIHWRDGSIRARAAIPESTVAVERTAGAVPLEGTENSERAGEQESTVGTERAVQPDSTEITERAVHLESTEEIERAAFSESTEGTERAAVCESTVVARAAPTDSTEGNEQATEGESTKGQERAVSGESTAWTERPAEVRESTEGHERAASGESTDGDERLVVFEFDPAKHPRNPAGSPQGGWFISPGDATDQSPEDVAWQMVLNDVPRTKTDYADWAQQHGHIGYQLASVARAWTGGKNNDQQVREHLFHLPHVTHGYLTDDQAHNVAAALEQALHHAPPIGEPLHRGFVDTWAHKEGDVLQIGPSSFSRSAAVADEYIKEAWTGDRVHLTLEPGARAVPLDGIALNPGTQEVISGGRLQITKVERDTEGVVHVRAKQLP